ncbi:hypothetical protein B0H12DRAFT_1128868 [Mycena haematopus]|nr:hypothetical protein B0H12DRAFT_1128868 [Mycena haematopus]
MWERLTVVNSRRNRERSPRSPRGPGSSEGAAAMSEMAVHRKELLYTRRPKRWAEVWESRGRSFRVSTDITGTGNSSREKSGNTLRRHYPMSCQLRRCPSARGNDSRESEDR